MTHHSIPSNFHKIREARLNIAINRPSRNKRSVAPAHEPDVFSSPFAAVVLDWLEDIFETVRSIEASALGWQKETRAIRLPEVLSLMGISKSTLYDRLNRKSASHDPDMPRPFKLGNSDSSASVWWHHDVVGYLQSRADLQRSN